MNGDGLSHQERIARGRRAAEMLEDPVYLEAVAAARKAAVDRFLDSDQPDQTRAVAAWAMDKALSLVRDELRRILSEGQFAAEAVKRS